MTRPRTFDEATVLQKVTDAFWSAGYAATSISDLMDVTGLGKGSLYGAFGDKHALFLRAFGQYCAGLVAATRAVLSQDGMQPGAAVADFLCRSTATTVADLGNRGCLLATATAELSPHDPAVVELAKDALQTVRDLLEDAIDRGQQSGEIATQVTPRELASLVLTISRGIDALRRAGASSEELAGIAENSVRLVLQSPRK
jgi:TetR/AcrR family transcriptional repressor of nem operon